VLDEIETHLTVIEATIDVGGLGIDKALSPDDFGKADEEAHGEAPGRAMISIEKSAIERRELWGHPLPMWWKLTGASTERAIGTFGSWRAKTRDV
jgi:hypothetical protein